MPSRALLLGQSSHGLSKGNLMDLGDVAPLVFAADVGAGVLAHDQASDVFATWIAPSSPTVRRVARERLVEGRELERGNAHPGSIGRDFGRFGFEVWRELHRRDARAAGHNESLALLNDARNGLAHSDDAKLASLRDRGHPLVLDTFRRWRRDLDLLAANLDAETSGQLARLFDRQRPW